MRSIFKKSLPFTCVGQPEQKCRNRVPESNNRCDECWNSMSTSDNGLIRLQASTDLATIKGVNAETFARLANDPVTSVRLGVAENAPELSSGWQLHMVNDKEVSIWRTLAQRHDMCHPVASQLVTKQDDLTLHLLMLNPVCPTSTIRWIASHSNPELAAAAKKIISTPST